MKPAALLALALVLAAISIAGIAATAWAYTVAHVDGAAVMLGFTVVAPALLATCTWLHRRELQQQQLDTAAEPTAAAPPAADPAPPAPVAVTEPAPPAAEPEPVARPIWLAARR